MAAGYDSHSGELDPAEVERTLRFFSTDPKAMALPPVESPFFEALLANVPVSHPLREVAQRYARDGYVVLDLASADFDAMAARITGDLAPRYPKDDRRVLEAWYFQPDVRALACNSTVLELLRFLYQREPIPFQTLNFDVGTEQATHSDMIHFYSLPRRYMCGVWVAFEEIDADNGPLHYYPGSHRLQDYDFHDLGLTRGMEQYPQYEHFVAALARVHGFERKELKVKKGQALIWAANLFHGGSPVRDPRRTRHSQVTHYFFSDCVYWLPAESDAIVGRACPREVIDLRSGRFVAPRHKGAELDLTRFEKVWRYPRPLPDWVLAANGGVDPIAGR